MPEMQRVGWRRVLVHDERVLRPLLGGRIIVRIEPLEMQLNSEDFRDAPERSARLRVFYIVGDWKGSGPQMRAWQCYFDEREIEETWAMVLNTAKAKGWL